MAKHQGATKTYGIPVVNMLLRFIAVFLYSVAPAFSRRSIAHRVESDVTDDGRTAPTTRMSRPDCEGIGHLRVVSARSDEPPLAGELHRKARASEMTRMKRIIRQSPFPILDHPDDLALSAIDRRMAALIDSAVALMRRVSTPIETHRHAHTVRLRRDIRPAWAAGP